VTQLYQEEMRKHGLDGSTHFTILHVLATGESLNQGDLATALAADSTTLSRTLRLMERNGWIRIRPGRNDKRERRINLTAAGRRQLEKSRPDWERAQTRLREALGDDWESLARLLQRVAEAGRTA